MNYEFKIIAFTNDPQFSISLTKECNKYGFSPDSLFKISVAERIIAIICSSVNEGYSVCFLT